MTDHYINNKIYDADGNRLSAAMTGANGPIWVYILSLGARMNSPEAMTSSLKPKR